MAEPLRNFRCTHENWYKRLSVDPEINHPCSKCACCIKGKQKLYDPTNCEACTFFLGQMFTSNTSQIQCIAAWRRWEESFIRIQRNSRKNSYEYSTFQWVSLPYSLWFKLNIDIIPYLLGFYSLFHYRVKTLRNCGF